MKMGNIASPWRYDAGAFSSLQSTCDVALRRGAMPIADSVAALRHLP
jgi:hypothetical protein